jgi:hypothetical protein
VWYISFTSETPVPVTRDEDDASCAFEIDPGEGGRMSIVSLFDSAEPGALNGERIRLKLVGIGNEPLFADADGGLMLGRQERAATPAAASELDTLVNGWALEQGCDAVGR